MSRLAGKPFVKTLLHMPHSLTSSLFVRAGSSACSQVANLQPIRNSSNSKKKKLAGTNSKCKDAPNAPARPHTSAQEGTEMHISLRTYQAQK